MRKLLRAVILAGAIVSLVAACGATSAPEVVKEVVKETVLVEKAVTSLVAKEVTSIASPPLTEGPKAAPTSTSKDVAAASPTPDLTAGWETHATAEYSLRLPRGLMSNTGAAGAGSGSVSFRFMGPKQVASGRTQTELFDGYAFVVERVGLTSEKGVEEFALEEQAGSKEACTLEGARVSDLREVVVDGGKGQQYSVEGCNVDLTATFVANGSNVYRVTQLYVGEAGAMAKYREITEVMLGSLQFRSDVDGFRGLVLEVEGAVARRDTVVLAGLTAEAVVDCRDAKEPVPVCPEDSLGKLRRGIWIGGWASEYSLVSADEYRVVLSDFFNGSRVELVDSYGSGAPRLIGIGYPAGSDVRDLVVAAIGPEGRSALLFRAGQEAGRWQVKAVMVVHPMLVDRVLSGPASDYRVESWPIGK